MILYPLTHNLDIDTLENDGLILEKNKQGKTYAFLFLNTHWNTFERTKTFGRAIHCSPMPLATSQHTIKTIHAWEKTRTTWQRLGRMPVTWLDGTIRPSILALVTFNDQSSLVFKRHPKKNNASHNASFMLCGSLPLETDPDFTGEITDNSLNTLLELFEKHTPHNLVNTQKTFPQTALARHFGTIDLSCSKHPDLEQHDKIISDITQTYFNLLCARQPNSTMISLLLNGRTLTPNGQRTPFNITIRKSHKITGQFIAPKFFIDNDKKSIEEYLTTLSDQLHPMGGIVMNTENEHWKTWENNKTEAASSHKQIELIKKLKHQMKINKNNQ